MKVMLIAPVLGFAMKNYVESIAVALKQYNDDIELVLVVPAHFEDRYVIESKLKITIIKMPAPVEKLKRGMYYFNPVAQHALLSMLQNTYPDIVHVVNGDGYLINVLLRKYFPNHPLLLTIHDPYPHPYDYIGYINYFIRNCFVIKNFDGIHIHNQCFENQVKARLSSEQRVFVVPHGSFAHYYNKYDTSHIQKENSILFFGRLEYYKGIDVLVDAAIKLTNEMNFNTKIIIAGPGKLSSDLYAKIQKYRDIFELNNKFLADYEIAILFKKSSVTVLPYRQVTQSSLPSIAIAFGHKIIASNAGAFQEEIPRLGGILVNPGSVEDLACAMYKATHAPPTVVSSDIYNWGTIANAFRMIYSDLIVHK